MRRFIVMNPNLSVGRQGDIVTSDQLKMSDDKLDEWVEANHGIEIDVPVGSYEPPETEGETTTVISTLNGDDYADVWDDENPWDADDDDEEDEDEDEDEV